MNDNELCVGVIDLGTNAVRLQIARVWPDRIHEVIAQEREPVRLGEGAFNAGWLSEEAMDRALHAIQHFVHLARRLKANTLRAVATAAVREAHNRDEFVRRVAQETGVELEVISGSEEARLICLGVLAGRALRHGDHLLCDIGGGSTELALAREGEAQRCWSLEIGAVRLTEMFLSESDPPRAGDLERLRLFIDRALDRVPTGAIPQGIDLVGSGGTIGALAEILRLKAGTRRRSVPFNRAHAVYLFDQLACLRLKERRRIHGLDERRADILVAGAAILLRLLDRFGIEKVVPTPRGLRDGLVVDLIRQVGLPAGFARPFEHLVDDSLRALVRRCGVDESHADRVTAHALALFDGLARAGCVERSTRELLRAAATLHDVGQFIGYAKHHRHSYYIISSSELPGYSEAERELIANIARYHRRSAPAPNHLPFQQLKAGEQDVVWKLSAILRTAEALDRHRQAAIRRLEIQVDRRAARIVAFSEAEVDLERWSVETKAAPVFQEAFDLPLELVVKAEPAHVLDEVG